jgi:hypothetical protein
VSAPLVKNEPGLVAATVYAEGRRVADISVDEARDWAARTRRLAAWAAILAVPTAVAGIYGMNFEHMPELKWEHGYLGVLGLIAVAVVGLYAGFRRNGWL